MRESETQDIAAREPSLADTPPGLSNGFEAGSGPRVEPAMAALGRKLLSIIGESGITPNEITIIGLLLVLTNCAAYLWHHSAYWLGAGLAIAFAFDSLDGAVARLQHSQSAYGSYLDAVVDRYEEIATYFVIAWVNGWWMASFVAVSGSLLISYNKARTAIERKIENKAWPDMLERHARGWIICAGLLCDVIVPVPQSMGGHLIFIVLVVLGPLTHIVAIQRFLRARQILLSN
jgi:archaetidylinositol phosphate synthase